MEVKKFIAAVFSVLFAMQIVAAPVRYKAPELSDKKSWTMVIVPDTQTYIQKSTNHGIMHLMFSWMVFNKERLNIRQVLFTGDLVNNNDRAYPMPEIMFNIIHASRSLIIKVPQGCVLKQLHQYL